MRKAAENLSYQPGAVMCNLFLADEINRTSPKTQSALLEVMEEGSVTVDGITKPVPNPLLYWPPRIRWERRYADVARIPGGPFYDLSDHGISES